jgi:Pyruvate/2-oxoacid:ferredoxin oxidoreductase gamma subunit
LSNTVLLGAFAGLSGLFGWSAVERVIKHHFDEVLAEKNLAAARAGFDFVS